MDEVSTKVLDGKDPRLLEAKECIQAAALILAKLGPEMQRVSWLLEDSVMYIDEALANEDENARDLSFLDCVDDEVTEDAKASEAAR
jgi:hypothetical protein